MPRQVEPDVHDAFIEFRAEGESICLSVQCIYCQQIRAKNTTRQRSHLLKCAPYLQSHPNVSLQGSPDSDAPADPYGGESSTIEGPHTSLGFTPNPRINGRPSLPAPDGTPATKKQKTKHVNPNAPEIPLRDVHAAFEEFKANDEDKTVSARCIYCNNTRAKNTSRQREHLMSCAGYQSVLKEKIPANNLRHQFDEDDVASSLALPTPTIDLDFRLSIRVKPKLTVGQSNFGRLSWVSCIGGQWAGRFGKGIVLPGGQDTQTTVKDTATSISARYIIQTNDEHPALIVCNIKGWWVAEKEIMERLQDPVAADNVAAHRYKLRVSMELETGDERYSELNTGMWLGSGCRRGAEIVYDAYRIG
ncbi:hypothetical protein B0H67DRAFT_563434 [Lasiosphaeris hirsuta]|uniref:Uncharacterized protein n=1 Tax=Lasiosphaeris hirsuta TaxID=260670 RepID=A0AA40BBB0_9PEZI|nr:hypothetical protein B0H67DRAFT_563434 [Lasiosphaeris hirsuta]